MMKSYSPNSMRDENKRIILFGAGNLASNVVDILHYKGFEILGYISTEKAGTLINNLPVLGDIRHYQKNRDLQKEQFHIAIGENSIRYSILESIKNKDRLLSIISDHCFLADNCLVKDGTYISHGTIIQHDVSIGTCCIIDTGSMLEHHVKISDYVNISPGAILCGGVNIAHGAIVGAGATIIEKVSIGENSLIGAGSVVLSDIEPNVVAAGNPARIIKKRGFHDTYIK